MVKRCTLTRTGQDFAAKIINVKGMSQRGEAGNRLCCAVWVPQAVWTGLEQLLLLT